MFKLYVYLCGMSIILKMSEINNEIYISEQLM